MLRAAGALAIACACAQAQAVPDPPPPGVDAALELADQGIVVDREAGRVSVRAGVLHDIQTLGYPIEYLVVTEMGKTHESAFIVKAKPSVLDRCLRELGSEPGAGTHFVPKDPAPSQDEIDAGASSWDTVAGHGPLFDITVQWIDDDGVRHEAGLESMLVDLRDGEALAERGWIYIGSVMGQLRQGRDVVERFMADVEGNIVAIYLDGRGTSLFERNSPDGIDDTLYTLNPEAMPPRGAKVTLVFEPNGGVVEEG